jgi:hypothetical protein
VAPVPVRLRFPASIRSCGAFSDPSGPERARGGRRGPGRGRISRRSEEMWAWGRDGTSVRHRRTARSAIVGGLSVFGVRLSKSPVRLG